MTKPAPDRASELAAKFNDPANKRFDKIWGKELDIAEDLEQACNWYQSWSRKRDAFIAEGHTVGADNSAALVQFWDERLVKIVSRMAVLDEKLKTSTDSLHQEFNKNSMSLLFDIREALATLDDTQIKSGKAIFNALLPLMTAEPEAAQAPKAPEKGPLDGGNPFKKGPGA